MYVLDTNILIYHLNGSTRATEFLRNRAASDCYLSAITVGELLSFDQLDAMALQAIEQLISQFGTLPVDASVARLAAEIRRVVKVSLPDALIAATAIRMNFTLVTENLKDFRRIPNLSLTNLTKASLYLE